VTARRRLQRDAPGAARVALAAVTVVLLLAAGACGAAAPGASEAKGEVSPITEAPTPTLPVTVPSADGRQVTVDDVSRILPLWGNLSETVFALGLGDNVVGRDVSATFEGVQDLPLVTTGHDISAESVLSVQPTVVLAQTDTGPPEALDQLRANGVPVVVFDEPTSIDDVIPRIESIAAALGVPEAGQELADRTQGELDAAEATVPHDGDEPTVAFLYLRGSAGVYLLGGEGSGADSMIEAAGGVDAGTAIGLANPFTPITSEAMVKAAPDAILVTTSGLDSVGGIDALLAMPGIAQTPAAADRRVVALEDGLLYSFGARSADALRQLVEQLYGGGGTDDAG
jgi:iron complex transport system substrate-binding protein